MRITIALGAACLSIGCAGAAPAGGAPASDCTCGSGDECYEAASTLAGTEGETRATGERLIALAQCACDLGTVGGCNTLFHFSDDYVRDCSTLTSQSDEAVRTTLAGLSPEQLERVGDTCAIAGLVHERGTRIPPLNGRSYPRDPAAARRSFAIACSVGVTAACHRGGS